MNSNIDRSEDLEHDFPETYHEYPEKFRKMYRWVKFPFPVYENYKNYLSKEKIK